MGNYADLLNAQKQTTRPASPTPEPKKYSALTIVEENRKVGIEEKMNEGKVENRKIGNPQSRKVGVEEKRIVEKEESRKQDELFAINVPADRKDIFFFTDAEFKAIKRFVFEVEDELDINITKTDLARCAFKLLLDDYRENGDRGKVVRYLKGKVGK